MNNMSLTIEQDKKQSDIFNNTISTIISIDHTTITIINKASEKDILIYTVELWITMNFTDYKMIITVYEALKKALSINITELQTVAILIDLLTKVMFNKFSKKASTIYTAES